MPRRRSFLDYRLREVLPIMGLVVLILNIVGYLGGFLLVDFNARSTKIQFSQDGSRRDEQGTLETPDLDLLSVSPQRHVPTAPLPEFIDSSLVTRGIDFAKRTWDTTSLSKSVVQHFEPCVFRDGRDANDGRWYNFTVHKYTFYAYSALVDGRASILSDPVIRIIGLGTKIEDESEIMVVKLYCRLHYDEKKSVYVAMSRTVVKIGQGWVLNNEWVREYIFTCPMPKSKPPRAVTIVESPGSAVTTCVPVEVPVKAAKKEDFAVCVQVAFGKLDPYRLTEWLELQWLLGVRRAGIYSMDLDIESLKVFENYVKDGYVDLRKTDYIEHGQDQYLLHGSPVINDCLYRHMHLVHYIIVIDFDEVIMPRQSHQSLRQLVDFLRLHYSSMPFPPLNYIFYNNYYFLDLAPDTSISPFLTMLRYRKKAPVSQFGYSVKSIVESQACLAMHNHFCWTLTPKYTNFSYPHVVDFDIAVNHHYKKCHLNETECQNLVNLSTQDDIILQFKTDLQRRVGEKILAIKGHNI